MIARTGLPNPAQPAVAPRARQLCPVYMVAFEQTVTIWDATTWGTIGSMRLRRGRARRAPSRSWAVVPASIGNDRYGDECRPEGDCSKCPESSDRCRPVDEGQYRFHGPCGRGREKKLGVPSILRNKEIERGNLHIKVERPEQANRLHLGA